MRRLPRRSVSEWALAGAALPVVAAAKVTVRLIPFRWWRPILLKTLPGRSAPSALWTPRRIGWAVARTALLIPGATCLPQALAARTLLWLAGHPSTLTLGVRRDPVRGMEAHAWVESGQTGVVGIPQAGEFEIMPLPEG